MLGAGVISRRRGRASAGRRHGLSIASYGSSQRRDLVIDAFPLCSCNTLGSVF